MRDISIQYLMNLNVIDLLNQFKLFSQKKVNIFQQADVNSAYHQMPLDEQSRRLTQFVIGNQQMNPIDYSMASP